MTFRNQEQIVDFLIHQYPILMSPFDAFLTASTIADFSENIWQAFLVFQKTNQLPDLEVEGFTCKNFIQNGCAPITALSHLDWLLKNPQTAIRSLSAMKDCNSPLYHQTLF